jgi:triosephosphate isomerase
MIQIPTIMINAKTYNESSGKDAVLLAKDALAVAKKSKESIICVVQAADVSKVSETGVMTFAQHVDSSEPGAHTGQVSIKALQENGARGVLINHSENKISFKAIMKTIALLSEADMVSVVCVKTPQQAKKIAKLSPDIIAIEPPKLIGGDVSVTTANPTIITKAVQAVRNVNASIPVLCGAGVKNASDVQKAIELGAQGVLVASGVTKAKNKKQAIEDLAKGLK